MFYDYLDYLCAERGITVSGLLDELELSKSSASRWKSKGYEPSREAAKKIADYFGITVKQLMSAEIGVKKEPALVEEDQLSALDKEILLGFRRLSPAVQDLVRKQIQVWQESE